MTENQLVAFRQIADEILTTFDITGKVVPCDWKWIGPHMSQRMFGITETRAKDYAARHGGVAERMGR